MHPQWAGFGGWGHQAMPADIPAGPEPLTGFTLAGGGKESAEQQAWVPSEALDLEYLGIHRLENKQTPLLICIDMLCRALVWLAGFARRSRVAPCLGLYLRAYRAVVCLG